MKSIGVNTRSLIILRSNGSVIFTFYQKIWRFPAGWFKVTGIIFGNIIS